MRRRDSTLSGLGWVLDQQGKCGALIGAANGGGW
jgi:hypothetical protein